MKVLYAPWRSAYAKKVAHGQEEDTPAAECIFCQQFKEQKDQEHFIVRRFSHLAVILNLYPYNAGHLMILSLEHKKSLNQLSKDARIELIELTNESIIILQKIMKAQGINVGINLGKAAGAGIPAHFHQHILPRWPGDTNFLPTLAQTKQISFDLIAIYEQLKPHFDNIVL